MTTLAADWDELASADALWAVLSDPARKGGGWARDAFLESGAATVAATMARATGAGVTIRRGAALDFGCGAGRLVWGLSPHFDRVVGVDVSAEMARQARVNVAERGNITVEVNHRPDLSLFEDGAFDLVMTMLVLQHVPDTELALRFVSELVRVTAPGGVAVIQAPDRLPAAHRLQPLRRLYGLLRRLGVPARTLILRTPLQPMRMTPLPRARVEATVAAAGGRLLAAEPDGATGFVYVVAGPGTATADAASAGSASRATSAA